MGPRFEDITETTGIPLSPEAASMMYTRYHVAAQLAGGKRVLELGCGSGQGLGLLGRRAPFVVGGDYSMPLLSRATGHYGQRFPLVRLSGNALPFADGAFDIILFFEASYYVPDMEASFRDIARVLAPGGQVLFVNANPERPDFIASPHSVHYHTAAEFRTAFQRLDMSAAVQAAFPVGPDTGGAGAKAVGLLFSLARKVLDAFGLVPKTLRGRARLKRLVYRRLTEVPAELPDGFAEIAPRTSVGDGPVKDFKVLYICAEKPGAAA